jgi:hypothetical protein
MRIINTLTGLSDSADLHLFAPDSRIGIRHGRQLRVNGVYGCGAVCAKTRALRIKHDMVIHDRTMFDQPKAIDPIDPIGDNLMPIMVPKYIPNIPT